MCGKSAKTQKRMCSIRAHGAVLVVAGFMANLHMCGCTHSFACQMSLGDYGNFLGLCHGWVFNFVYFPRPLIEEVSFSARLTIRVRKNTHYKMVLKHRIEILCIIF